MDISSISPEFIQKIHHSEERLCVAGLQVLEGPC